MTAYDFLYELFAALSRRGIREIPFIDSPEFHGLVVHAFHEFWKSAAEHGIPAHFRMRHHYLYCTSVTLEQTVFLLLRGKLVVRRNTSLWLREPQVFSCSRYDVLFDELTEPFLSYCGPASHA